jgi:hypothetical protein
MRRWRGAATLQRHGIRGDQHGDGGGAKQRERASECCTAAASKHTVAFAAVMGLGRAAADAADARRRQETPEQHRGEHPETNAAPGRNTNTEGTSSAERTKNTSEGPTQQEQEGREAGRRNGSSGDTGAAGKDGEFPPRHQIPQQDRAGKRWKQAEQEEKEPSEYARIKAHSRQAATKTKCSE